MEILKEGASAWVLSEFEWRARWGASAVNIGNKILVMGKYFNPHVDMFYLSSNYYQVVVTVTLKYRTFMSLIQALRRL